VLSDQGLHARWLHEMVRLHRPASTRINGQGCRRKRQQRSWAERVKSRIRIVPAAGRFHADIGIEVLLPLRVKETKARSAAPLRDPSKGELGSSQGLLGAVGRWRCSLSALLVRVQTRSLSPAAHNTAKGQALQSSVHWPGANRK